MYNSGLECSILTDIICVEVLAEVSKTGPCQNEEVDFGDQLAFFGTSIQGIPDDAPNLVPK